MVWLLATFRSLENSYTSRVMSKVLRLCVESNLASATVALLALVLYVAMPGQAYFLAPTMVLGKIYSNTLLVSLNNRVALRDAASTATSSVFVHRHSVSVHQPPTDSHATNRTVVLQCNSLGEVQTPYEKYSLNSAERGVALELSTMDSHNW
ncbi:hypothetical protein FA95DRAFT_327408 [Auriscalpium vulgare]|uniref:Uncharacterized protein n=1 Tax=Auriscalpium vulgare TaxID=40419 RepID=A0ACB8RIA3_9AGAM|nr:hypothetical protein FA95DRAFT_327408 [Auriscalpium vulgare]